MLGRRAGGTRVPGTGGNSNKSSGKIPEAQAMRAGKTPRGRGEGVGGAAEFAGFGQSHLSGKAARAHSAQRTAAEGASVAKVSGGGGDAAVAKQAPSRPRQLPTGSPGKNRFASSTGVSSKWRQRHAVHADANVRDLKQPPKQSAALAKRVEQNRATLRAAYPEKEFNPQKLSKAERAIVSELDASSGRFGGWEHGRQGTGDFAEARGLADKRLEGGLKAETYRAPAPAAAADTVLADDARRNYSSDGPVPIGDVVRPSDDGSMPGSKDLVPAELHRAAAPAGLEGDRRGQVEYWSWQKAGEDPALNAKANAAHGKWSEQRDRDIPPEVVRNDWKNFSKSDQPGRIRERLGGDAKPLARADAPRVSPNVVSREQGGVKQPPKRGPDQGAK